ncbi:lysosomal Pro-X carboxypeptidase-like [Tropilaelaps mercedesae]|uniref:Lysosomal Pro-X carboxypeptidase n=1 Tax=Tropilaelaps mercedesae TaxID=418985 RepID=A0A1V9XRS1_9ACAR|nr:lysosomal Pro-X carboxypeptidase-like [Tropilaelaps mercedesae]
MRFSPVCVPFVALLASTYAYNYKTMWFETKVDHFGYANNDTFKMRVLYNDDHFDVQRPGPIFFYTGNEGNIEMFANNTGLMWDWAAEFKALLIFAEHRFYGKSMPYGAKSYSSVKYFGYLTVEQALADYADFLLSVKRTWPGAAGSKIAAFGGSYGGMLSAWMRMKYPWLIDAALAASAPILQFQGVTPCGVYNQIVTKAFKAEGDQCVDNIRKSWIALEKKGREGEKGADFLRKNFRICQPVLPTNYTAVRNWLYDTYGNLAMTNYPYAVDFLKKVPGHPVRVSCSYLQEKFSSDEELLFRIYKAINEFHNFSGDIQCNDLKNSGGSNLGDEGWRIQSCNEMVMPMCATGTSDMFYEYMWNFTDVRTKCEKKYLMTPESYKAQWMFGGADISSASNIIFSNGDIDPWSGGGVLESPNPSIPTVVIAGGAHHYDLRPAHPYDTAECSIARLELFGGMAFRLYRQRLLGDREESKDPLPP